jgi:energy-coupling factor transport system permease protein
MIASFKYIKADTFVHRLDPRTKIIMLLCAAFTAASLRDLRALLALLALTVVYYTLARLPWRETKAAWSFFLLFIVVVVGFNTLLAGSGGRSDTSPVLVQLPLGIAISWQNVIEAFSIMARMLVGAFMAIPITFTIPPTRFGVAFRGMGLNDRIAFAVDLAIRLVPTYAADFRSTIDAQRARGFEVDKLRGGILARLRRLAPLAVPVTMNAILSGEDITNALDMRGFGLRPRTWLHARRLRLVDWILIVLALALLVAGIAWRFAGGGQLWLPPYTFA